MKRKAAIEANSRLNATRQFRTAYYSKPFWRKDQIGSMSNPFDWSQQRHYGPRLPWETYAFGPFCCFEGDFNVGWHNAIDREHKLVNSIFMILIKTPMDDNAYDEIRRMNAKEKLFQEDLIEIIDAYRN